MSLALPLPLFLRLAARSLRGGARGFGIFFACIALGVATVAGVGSLARGIGDGLARQGSTILGGDVSFALIQREIEPREAAFLAGQGALSSVATLRSMARRGDADSALVEIKAVDAAYPPAGALALSPREAAEAGLPMLLAARSGVFGAAVDAQLASRLALAVGDRFRLGALTLEMRGIVEREPDRLSGGVGFGPRVLLSQEALRATGLLQPGSLVRWTYRLKLSDGGDAAVARVVGAANAAFPEAGWDVRTRDSLSPQFSRSIARLAQFLSLVGLTALAAGGAGVGSAVSAHVTRRRADIATLKALGAPAQQVFLQLLAEIAMLALIGTLPGLLLGAALPFALAGLFGALMPFPLVPAVYPGQLAVGFAYGLGVALLFALPALGRAHDIPVSGLFRYDVAPARARLRGRYRAMIGIVAALLIGLAWLTAADRRLALVFLASATGIFAVLRLTAAGLMALARRLPHPRGAVPRLALAAIHRPGALTPAVFVSLGLALSLLTALVLVDFSLREQFTRSLPRQSPSFFFLDIPNRDAEAFEAFLRGEAKDARIEQVAMLRGRIVALNGARAENAKAAESAAWALEGDRGITTALNVPEGSRLVAGDWWAADYAGPPLVSLEEGIAQGLRLKVGDAITVNVMGRDIKAGIASLRKVNWRSMGINFVLVFSPNTFAGAPHTNLATLAYPGGFDAARETALMQALARGWPNVTAVRVKETFDALNDLFNQVAIAVRAASAIVVAAAVLALAGALAASQETRNRDAVVLKVLGARRGMILRVFLAEYAALGGLAAGFGLAAGTLAAWAVCRFVMEIDFAFAWQAALGTALAAVAAMIVLGLVGSWRILGQKAAGYLRSA